MSGDFEKHELPPRMGELVRDFADAAARLADAVNLDLLPEAIRATVADALNRGASLDLVFTIGHAPGVHLVLTAGDARETVCAFPLPRRLN